VLATAFVPRRAGAAEHEDGGKTPTPGEPIFVDVAPIVLPVVERNSVTRQVGVLLTMELADQPAIATVTDKRRELRDAFITELYRLYGWRSTADRVVKETLIKQRLQLAADRVLGPGVVRAILIRQIVEQER
jgi:flagellar FliL protein